MRKFRGFTALLACVAVVAASLVVASTTAEAQPPQPTAAVPPIIGNAADGILRNVPTQYYAAIDDFENTAIQEVLDTHNLPPSDAQAVKAWGRDAVRTQEYLDLLSDHHQAGSEPFEQRGPRLRVVPGSVQGPAGRPGAGGRRPVPEMVRSHDGHDHRRPDPGGTDCHWRRID